MVPLLTIESPFRSCSWTIVRRLHDRFGVTSYTSCHTPISHHSSKAPGSLEVASDIGGGYNLGVRGARCHRLPTALGLVRGKTLEIRVQNLIDVYW